MTEDKATQEIDVPSVVGGACLVILILGFCGMMLGRATAGDDGVEAARETGVWLNRAVNNCLSDTDAHFDNPDMALACYQAVYGGGELPDGT